MKHRDDRIQENMDLVGILGAQLAGPEDYYEPYRDDMESAGRVALVEAATTYQGAAFRAFAETVIRRAMVAEAQKLDGTVRPGPRGEQQYVPVDFVTMDVDALAEVPSPEDGVLAKVDRERALDPEYRERERRVPVGLTLAAFGRLADLSELDYSIWVRRRVQNEQPLVVARALDMSPRSLQKRERAIVNRVGGK